MGFCHVELAKLWGGPDLGGSPPRGSADLCCFPPRAKCFDRAASHRSRRCRSATRALFCSSVERALMASLIRSRRASSTCTITRLKASGEFTVSNVSLLLVHRVFHVTNSH